MKRELVIVCLLCLSFGVFCERTTKFNVTYRDKMFTDHFKSYTTDIPNPMLCTKKCLEDVETPCLSFAYHARDQVCYLYNHVQFENSPFFFKAAIVTYVPELDSIEKGKPTPQNETFEQDEEQYGSDKAIDGDLNTFMMISINNSRWWCVDLLKIHSMRLIQIVNWIDYPEQLNWFYLRFGMTGNCDEADPYESTWCTRARVNNKTHYDITKCTEETTEMKAKLIFIRHYQYTYLPFSELNILLDYSDNSDCSSEDYEMLISNVLSHF